MKKIYFVALCILLVSTLTAIAQSEEEDKKQLTGLLHNFLEGASKNDKATHENFWAEDLIYTSSAGLRFGKDKIMSNFDQQDDANDDAVATVYTAEDIIIQLYGDMAVVAFKMKGESPSATSYFLNSGTFLKRNGQWKVVNWQATKASE